MVFAACLFAFHTRLNMSDVAKILVDRFAIITGVLFGAAVLFSALLHADLLSADLLNEDLLICLLHCLWHFYFLNG